MAFINIILTNESFNLLTRIPYLKYFYYGNIKYESSLFYKKVVTKLKRFIIRI